MKTLLKPVLVLALACSIPSLLLGDEPKSDKQHPRSTQSGKPHNAEKPSAVQPDSSTAQKSEDAKSKDPLENMRFRNLGPAVGGGRITAVAGIPGKSNIYYAGAGGGGVFLTQDGGLSWKPIFEKQSTASIGAIALAPSNPNLVWVGTGESNLRNDVITGKGVFFSPDAGTTWNFMGLKDAG